MDTMELIRSRHSVRQFDGLPIAQKLQKELEEKIKEINEISGQSFQLVCNEPKAFSSRMAKYGRFSNVANYIAAVGKDPRTLGYYGQLLVMYAQSLGLKSCWVALTYKKIKGVIHIPKGGRLYCVIALGTSSSNGVQHPLKTASQLTIVKEQAPKWFDEGMEGVVYAPSALNQQKYRFGFQNGKAFSQTSKGPYTQIDLGIAQYQFDLASHTETFKPEAENRSV